VTPLPRLALELGTQALGIKRDDLSPALSGGTKPRKLDYLLADPLYRDAKGWHALGALGSGQLVALTAAAKLLNRTLHAQLFWTDPCDELLNNLAFVASGPTKLRYQRTRPGVFLRRPGLFVGSHYQGLPVVPPGATHPVALLGMVRAAFELVDQIRSGELPEPERLYLALGTGGTAVGLAVGLALAGLSTRVHAVAVVEHVFSPSFRFKQMTHELLQLMELRSLIPPGTKVAPLVIDRTQLGKGYAFSTQAGDAARAKLSHEGVELEGTYTAKAMAAMLRDVGAGAAKRSLFWMTAYTGELPHEKDWKARLPTRLKNDLERAISPIALSRRRLWQVGGVVGLSALVLSRATGYPDVTDWRGTVLSEREVVILMAAVAPFLAPAPEIADPFVAARAVDGYLASMPTAVQDQVHALFHLVEHATPIGLSLRRFTRLSFEDRRAFLKSLDSAGGTLSEAHKGLRALCLLAYYQSPASWPSIGYDGPLLPLDYDPRGPERHSFPHYEALLAPAGALPQSLVR
jgi:D-cysteine desulfhydrase